MFDQLRENIEPRYQIVQTFLIKNAWAKPFLEFFVLRALLASLTIWVPVRFFLFPMLSSEILTGKGIYPTALILGLLFILFVSILILLMMIFILQALIGRDRRWLSFFGVLAGMALGISFLG